MKYFPSKLWLDFNSRSEKIRNAADRTWKKNFQRYRQSLKRVLPGLNAEARRFFQEAQLLHDGTLNRMEVGDQINRVAGPRQTTDWDRRNAQVRLFVLPRIGNYIYELNYKSVSDVRLEFPGKSSLFPAGAFPNFGDWGYDELSRVRDGVFLHDILFSSGASICIQFRDLAVRRKRMKGLPHNARRG